MQYALSEQRNLIFVIQGISSQFTNQQLGTPSQSSTSFLALAGIDYRYNGVWQYRFLLGFEVRSFESLQFSTQTAPIVRGDVIWTPNGLTTVTGTVLRSIEDPIQADTSGYIYSSAQLRVDHEYLRNVLLNAKTGVRVAQYLQGGGTQSQVLTSVPESIGW